MNSHLHLQYSSPFSTSTDLKPTHTLTQKSWFSQFNPLETSAEFAAEMDICIFCLHISWYLYLGLSLGSGQCSVYIDRMGGYQAWLAPSTTSLFKAKSLKPKPSSDEAGPLLLKLMLALTNPKDPKKLSAPQNMVEAHVLTHVRAGLSRAAGAAKSQDPHPWNGTRAQNGKPGITQRSCSKKCTAIVTI